MWVEDLSNLARLKSEALPVRPLDCVRAVLATAEKITKQQIRTRLTKRLRLPGRGGWCPAGRLSPCWRFLRRPKERSWREPPPSRHRCENVPASAGRCAPLRKARCEKGSGWACALLSRRDDLRRETLPWCTEENTSTKFSQSPLRDAQFPIKGYEAFELGERPRLCSRSGQSLP